MKTYRNEKLGIEFQVPEEWIVPKSSTSKSPVGDTIAFKCRYYETFEIQINPLTSDPSPEQVANEFRKLAEKYNITHLEIGRINVENKEHTWARFYRGGGKWTKKYQTIISWTVYAITAQCFYQNMLLEREKVWDAVVKSFRSISSHSLDTSRIMTILAQPAQLRDIPKRIELCEQALAQVSRKFDPELWAGLQLEMGNNLAKNPAGNRDENIQQSIDTYLIALEVFTRQDYPDEWANIQTNLASNYRNRQCGKKEDDIEQAIHLCNQALEAYTGAALPEVKASTHNNLANALRDRILGDRAENLEQAIYHCQQALALMPKKSHPWKWATAQNNLGNIYMVRLHGNHEENVEKAIQLYIQALEVFTQDAYPEDWAWTHTNLARAYLYRDPGNKEENFERFSHHCHQALEVYSEQAYPDRWKEIQNILALAGSIHSGNQSAMKNFDPSTTVEHPQALDADASQSDRATQASGRLFIGHTYLISRHGDREKNLKQAIDIFQQALANLTREDNPQDWASAQNGLGEGYRNLSLLQNRGENLDQAMFHYHQALEVATPALNADLWAAIHNNLGIAYANITSGDRAENHEQAIFHCQQALKVYTRAQFPDDWAMTHNNLGCAYRTRVLGDRVTNVQQAISHFEHALSIQDKQADGEQRAGTHHNLLRAYADILDKNEVEYNEKIIFHGQRALDYYSRETNPNDWAGLHLTIGSAFGIRTIGNPAENLNRAIYHLQQALEGLDAQTIPQAWGSAQSGLAYAFARRSQGKQVGDLTQAIFHFQQVLTVFTQAEYPNEWAMAQRGLAMVELMRQGAGNEKIILTYPQFYIQESALQPGAKHTLKLIYSDVPDVPFVTHLLLVYEWEEGLPAEEAEKLAQRSIAYISCAIYDAAIQAGLACQPSPIPNGRRPAWLLEGEQSPVSLTLSDIDLTNRNCQLTIGAVVVALSRPPSDRTRWEKLHASFKAKFSEIRV